ncbi:MAG: Tyrosine recombinase XerC [Candidatus Heimdallarchaeota archaeon LC_3]|nr:MAG: Tyrosine recombinase XerC [Candidatus Heimdallarchaeota archaeon LC_3]
MNIKYEFQGEYVKFWKDIEKHLIGKKVANGTIENRRKALTSFIKLTNSTKISDLENVKFVETFIAKFKGKDSSLIIYLSNLSSIIENFKKRGEFEEIYKFKKNPFAYKMEDNSFENDGESHKARTKLEIEIWIKLITDKQYKLLFMFYATALRLSEPLELRKTQFNLEKREMLNVVRKGKRKNNKNKIQKKLGIPKWMIPILEDHLKTVDDKLFNINTGKVDYFTKAHFKKLTELREKLEKKGNLNNYWQRVKDGLDLIVSDGKIIPHQLRKSWNTLAVEGRMFESFRKFHMNHSSGIQDIYTKIYDIPSTWREYLEELDNHSPQFVF